MFGRSLLGGVLAALIATAGQVRAAPEDCQAAPTGSAPQGHHWYYYLNRETNRKCWFLGDEGMRLARDATPKKVAPQKPAERHQAMAQSASVPAPEPTASAEAPAGYAQQTASDESTMVRVAADAPAGAGVPTAAAPVIAQGPSADAAQAATTPPATPDLPAPAATPLPEARGPARVAAAPEQPAPEPQSVSSVAEPAASAPPPSQSMPEPAAAPVAGTGATPMLSAQSGRLLAIFGGILLLGGLVVVVLSWLVRRRDVTNRTNTAVMDSARPSPLSASDARPHPASRRPVVPPEPPRLPAAAPRVANAPIARRSGMPASLPATPRMAASRAGSEPGGSREHAELDAAHLTVEELLRALGRTAGAAPV
jgi:hypothetical protein